MVVQHDRQLRAARATSRASGSACSTAKASARRCSGGLLPADARADGRRRRGDGDARRQPGDHGRVLHARGRPEGRCADGHADAGADASSSGLIVAFIALSLIMPMYQLVGDINDAQRRSGAAVMTARLHSERGVSLVETLVAVAILGTALVDVPERALDGPRSRRSQPTASRPRTSWRARRWSTRRRSRTSRRRTPIPSVSRACRVRRHVGGQRDADNGDAPSSSSP